MYAAYPTLCIGEKVYSSVQTASLRICSPWSIPGCCDTEKTHVKPVFRGSKIASHPKTFDPRAGTITPSVRPSKIIGSVPGNTGLKNQCLWRVARRITAIPGPAEYAKVQTASASFVGNPTRSAFNPSCPSSAMKCLIYGPGSPPSAL